MTLTQGSAICRFFTALWAVLTDAWTDSRVGDVCRAVQRAVCKACRQSVICGFISRESLLSRSWPASLTCRALTVVVNLPGTVCKWVYSKAQNFWEGSLVCRFIGTLGNHLFVPLGLFLTVMLVAPYELWKNPYALVGAVFLFALYAVGTANKSRGRIDMREVGPYLPLFWGFVCYAFLASLNTHLSARFLGFHLTAFLLVVLIVSSVHKYEQVELLVVLALCGITIAALYGCYQGVTGVAVVENQQDMALNKGMPGRVYSFFDNPNNFAELLVMLMPLDVAMFLNSKTWRGRLASAFSFAVCAASLGFTLSRGCWIGVAVAALVFLAFVNWKLIPLLVVAGVCCVPLLPDTIYNRLLTIGNTKDTSTSYRFSIYEATGNLMKDYWARGVGLGSDVVTQTFESYPTMFDGHWPIHTHNNYLQMWVETGLLGALSYVAAMLYQLKAAIKSFHTCADKRVRTLLAAAVSGFCGILVVSVAEYTWFFPRNMFLFWALIGVIGACIKVGRNSVKAKQKA